MEVSLLYLKAGKKAEIKKLDGGFEFQRRLASLNIRVGKTIRKVAAQPFGGPVIVEIDKAKVTIGRGMANKIILETEE